MYCEFKLMVRLSLFFGNRFCTRYMTEVLQWWLFFREEVRHALVGFGYEIV